MATFTAAKDDYSYGSKQNFHKGHEHHACCYNFAEDPEGQGVSRWGALYIRLMPDTPIRDNLSNRWRAIPPMDYPAGVGLVILGLFLMIVYAVGSGLARVPAGKGREGVNLTLALLNTTLTSLDSEIADSKIAANTTYNDLAKSTVILATTVTKEPEATSKGLSGSFNGSVFDDQSLESEVNSDKNMTENKLNLGAVP